MKLIVPACKLRLLGGAKQLILLHFLAPIKKDSEESFFSVKPAGD